MDKYEARRLSLLRLVNEMGRGGRVKVAQAIGKSPDYISRMLYPKEKAGHKGIGEDSVEALDRAFPDWMNYSETGFIGVKEPEAAYKFTRHAWPFKSISPDQWAQIPIPTKEMLEQQIKALVPPKESNKLAA
jgi:hypothetical protein